MKAILHSQQRLLPAARSHARDTACRTLSSTSSTSSSRAAALAKAAEASTTASQRSASPGAPAMGPSYRSRQDANKLDSSLRLLSDHDDANAHLNLSSSQARRSHAARFGTSRHTTYASTLFSGSNSAQQQPIRTPEEQDEDQELALAYASPTGTSTSSIYLPEYVAWAISQLITAANDPKLLRADHLKLAHLTDPQEHMAEAAHIPPKRSSLLHLATVSPHRYAAILAVLSEVRQRLSSPSLSDTDLDRGLPRWAPDTVLDFDCAAGEGLWAAAQVFREDNSDATSSTSLQRYQGYDRRPNLLKSGKKVAQSSAYNVSPADPAKSQRQVKLKDEGEEIEVDGVTYYEQESEDVEEQHDSEDESDQQPLEYFGGPKSAMANVEKTFQSVPLAKDLSSIAGHGGRTLALSAFALSLMTNDSNRFEAVQAMWDSGADVIVIIDQATRRGFASVASARAQLLQLGERDAHGSHIVAPCSHDKPCPLLHPFAISSSVASAVGARNPAKSNDICAFTARYHTPTFLRRTKHSDRGEENVGYSYVVVRRGTRPSLVGEAQRRLAVEGRVGVEEEVGMMEELLEQARSTKTGILDLLRTAKRVGSERRKLEEVDTGASEGESVVREDGEMSDEQAMDEMLRLLPEAVKAEFEAGSNEQITAEQLDAIMASVRSSTPSSSSIATTSTDSNLDDSQITIDAPTAASELAMRLESYSWPRLVKPPLKKGGHVTLDACCSSGNIERFTISKASGKQAYQDARKAKWGDLFPHPSRSKSSVKAINPLFALEVQGQEAKVENLTLRNPSKLQPSKNKHGEMNDLDSDLDLDLDELFPSHPSTSSGPINPNASYSLISPNLITPTPKQSKRISINYNKKWTQPSTTSSFESSLDKPPTQRRSSRKKSRGDHQLFN